MDGVQEAMRQMVTHPLIHIGQCHVPYPWYLLLLSSGDVEEDTRDTRICSSSSRYVTFLVASSVEILRTCITPVLQRDLLVLFERSGINLL